MRRHDATTKPPPPCPEGGPDHGEPTAAVRQGRVDFADVYPHLMMRRGTVTSIADVGWRCVTCGHEWGWEVLTDAYMEAVELLTGGTTLDHQEQAVVAIALWHGKGRDPLGEGV